MYPICRFELGVGLVRTQNIREAPRVRAPCANTSTPVRAGSSIPREASTSAVRR